MPLQSDFSVPVFLDYEGTLATSVTRHYHQYLEALNRIRRRFALPDDLAVPQPKEHEFYARYGRGRDIGDVTPFAATSLEAKIVRAIIKRQHQEVIWEYDVKYMAYERLLPGAVDAISKLSGIANPVLVSYTRQEPDDFADHVGRMGIVSQTLIHPALVHTVGGGGGASRDAKANLIHTVYGSLIERLSNNGIVPVLVGDDVSDMYAAFDAKVDFVGVTETGKASKAEFERAYQSCADLGRKIDLVDSIADPRLILRISQLRTLFDREGGNHNGQG